MRCLVGRLFNKGDLERKEIEKKKEVINKRLLNKEG